MVQTTVQNTHAPNKVSDVHGVLLMGVGCKDDRGAPGAETFTDPAIAGFEDLELLQDNLALLRTVVRFLAAGGRGGAGVYGEFNFQRPARLKQSQCDLIMS